MSLKRIVKSAFNQDPLEQIFWGHPTNDTYNKVIQNYHSITSQEKDQMVNRIIKKMQKPKQTDLVISNLALLHKIMKINTVYLPSIQPLIQQSKKKQFAGEKSFIKFYYAYLKNTQRQILMKRQTFEDNLDYCDVALNKCFDIVKNNIVIDYCIQHSTNQICLRIALRQIFEDIKKDLFFTTDIIERNVKRIYQENTTTSFALNEVYEKLLQLNRTLTKITVLIKKANLSIDLPVYELDRDTNMKIEMEMNMRKDQKVKFKTQKLIKSQKNIEIEDEFYQPATMKQINYGSGSCNNYQYLSEIQEDQILIHQCEQIY